MQDDINAPILSPNRRDSAAFDDIVKMDSLGHKVAEKGQVRKAFDYFYDRMDVPEIAINAFCGKIGLDKDRLYQE